MVADMNPSPLDRAAFIAIVPALALPAIAATSAAYGESGSLGVFAGLNSVIVAAFMFVLLGSMALNAWLILRHPQTFAERAVPRAVTVPFALLVAVLVVWSVVLAAGSPSVTLYGFAPVVITLSIIVCAQAGIRQRHRMPVARVTATTLPTAGRVLGVVYLVVAVAFLTSTLLGPALGSRELSALGAAFGSWPLVLLGLPWSWPVAIGWYILAIEIPGASAAVVALTALPVVANVVLVALVLWNPAARTRITNWFFRLHE